MERPDKNIETADILRSVVRDGGRRGAAAWVGAALPPARGRRTAPLSAFLALGVILTETQCKSSENVI